MIGKIGKTMRWLLELQSELAHKARSRMMSKGSTAEGSRKPQRDILMSPTMTFAYPFYLFLHGTACATLDSTWARTSRPFLVRSRQAATSSSSTGHRRWSSHHG